MRKILSLALAGITAVSVLVSCSNPSAESSFTASEEMTKYETLIKDRFGITSDSLVIATGDEGAKYGVDTDKFIDDEGYTIRASDGDVVIIGKTGAGIDRAVRQFTNYGNLEDYTFTYGEGYRVKKLTVNGNDILDYAVVYPNDADECMLFATDELVKYIELTCGTVLPKYSADMYASAESKPAHTIALSMDYPTLGDEAFTINVKDDGNIDILCGRYRGGLYGVYDLLKDMGWRFLSDGTEYL